MCASCGGRTSVTAGTIFERTRTPLTVWFTAGWLFATGKDGISALSLQRTLEIGSYQTAWAMLHRLRSVLVRPGRDRLAGASVAATLLGDYGFSFVRLFSRLTSPAPSVVERASDAIYSWPSYMGARNMSQRRESLKWTSLVPLLFALLLLGAALLYTDILLRPRVSLDT